MSHEEWKILCLGFALSIAATVGNASEPLGDQGEPAAPPWVSGATIEIVSHSIDGGSSGSTGGEFQLQGTIGQPVADNSSASEVELSSGFWIPAILDLGCTGMDTVFCDGFESGDAAAWD